MTRYRELKILVSASLFTKLQREARQQTRSTSDQAHHYIREALGLSETNKRDNAGTTTATNQDPSVVLNAQ